MTHRRQGACRQAGGDWEFVLWAPLQNRITLEVQSPERASVEMRKGDCGYHSAVVEGLAAKSTYFYRISDGRTLPDPASRYQPGGVHGPSQVVDPDSFAWTDHAWKGRDLRSSIFYELHVGTFTDTGTFDAVIPYLSELADLGVTTLELMPVAQFPGSRNWGYDGVHPYAAQNTYGGPWGLQRLVDACHAHGLAVALDVVYNHLGPEGNYLGVFGPYFRSRYKTPWGEAINFDAADSDPVRAFFIDNALYWVDHFHVDALRLDAIHGIFDFSATHFLKELQERVQGLSRRLGRRVHVIAESDLNDARVLHSHEKGGYALDAQWSDDFHHSVHTLVTGERSGYYQDFGTLAHLTETLRNGWYYTGQYSKYRRRRFGNSPAGIELSRHVVCTQNHDQVGNRAAGDRLSALVDFERLKLVAGISLLSPFLPLLFMGEEYGETSPFAYFVSHTDADLVEAVRRGRRHDFASFAWKDEVPDPQAESTFLASRLVPARKTCEPNATLRRLYKKLIAIRREHCLGQTAGAEVAQLDDHCLILSHGKNPGALRSIFNFAGQASEIAVTLPHGGWTLLVESSDTVWQGPGSTFSESLQAGSLHAARLQPWSFAVLELAPATSGAKD